MSLDPLVSAKLENLKREFTTLRELVGQLTAIPVAIEASVLIVEQEINILGENDAKTFCHDDDGGCIYCHPDDDEVQYNITHDDYRGEE